MVTLEDLESYLIRMDVEYEEVAEGMFLVRGGEEGLPIVVNHSPPLLFLRLKVMDLSQAEGSREELYRTLLELNASDVVHGAYAVEGDEIVLSHTLLLEALTYTELQASLESILLAASSHMERLRSLAAAPVKG
ncbi:MAG: YbjN domain-containing protein [Gemmatimonadota bacterium]